MSGGITLTEVASSTGPPHTLIGHLPTQPGLEQRNDILIADSAHDDVVRCFIEATLKHSKAPGAVRASKKRYPFLRPVISRGCQG